MIELSRYVLDVLRKDDEFVLYRGRSQDGESQALVLSPVAEYPRPESLKRLEHEYSLEEELDPGVGCPTNGDCSPLGPYGARAGGSRRCASRSITRSAIGPRIFVACGDQSL